MVAIVDYGVGNLFSLRSSLSAVGAEAVVTGDTDLIRQADKVILPGVGAFADAAPCCGIPVLGSWSVTWPPKESLCLVSAWGCSCSLRRAWSTAAIQDWG